LEVLSECRLEPSLKNAKPGDVFQFERMGYFCLDRIRGGKDLCLTAP
jgi:glutaminyl-tRNA synthetase